MKAEQRSITPSTIPSEGQPANSPTNEAPGVGLPAEAGTVARGQDVLLTMAEASALLRCSKAHVSNLIRGRVPNSPRLPAVRLGRRVYLRRGSFERYLYEIEQQTAGWNEQLER